jgi:threonylcarbamoyladenosine tRNA methylthiotransferase MtaB
MRLFHFSRPGPRLSQGGNKPMMPPTAHNAAPAAAGSVAIKSIGCRTNQEEMATLRGELEQTGFAVVDDVKTADIVIVNTCSVTSVTESKTRRLLHAISREAPNAGILVTGCLAQQKPDELKAFDNVFWIVGNARKHEIPGLLREKRRGVFYTDHFDPQVALPGSIAPPAPGRRTRFSVKIQEGCDHRCAYCIVPFLRGPSRSAPASGIIDVCERAVYAGHKELILTGTHIGQFRDETGKGLPALVERIINLPGDFRVRMSSLDPRELTDELCDMVGGEKKICDHLHVSLQSLSPAVLKIMSRSYASFDDVVGRLERFRAKYPDAGLGADFIVGFPGETEAHFLETISLVERIGFSYAHLFRFSPRPGTAAASFPDTVPEAVKTGRSERLRSSIENSRERFVQTQRGRAHRIIVEQGNPLRGVTSNFLSVEGQSFSALHNSWIDVIIDGTMRNGRFCCKLHTIHTEAS